MLDGLALESEVVRLLRLEGWEIETSEALDHEGIDFVIRGRYGREFVLKGAFQLTYMGGNVYKLRQFLKTRSKYPDAAHFYIVPRSGMSSEAVFKRVNEILEIYLLFTQTPAGFYSGFFLVEPKATKPETWVSFNVEDRIIKLDARGNPKANQETRRSGRIVLMPKNAILIREDGKERRIIWGYDADTLDNLARYMRRYRHYGGASPMSIAVSYIPYEDEDGDLRALSIRFLAETRDP